MLKIQHWCCFIYFTRIVLKHVIKAILVSKVTV